MVTSEGMSRWIFGSSLRGKLVVVGWWEEETHPQAPLTARDPLLAATITDMLPIVGNADSMKPFQRVRIRVTDSVRAYPDQEVVSLGEDVAGPADHAVVRRVVPGAVVPLASRRRMDRDRSVAHLELIG